VLAAGPPEPPELPDSPWPEPVHVPRAEIERHWPGGAVELRGRIEPVERVERLTAGVQQTLDVRAVNEGDRPWGAGKEARPELRIAYRWHGGWHGAASDERALRTPFPAEVAPGESQLVPVHVVPPARPGRYRLELDLVHEHVRWLGAGFELDVEVVPRRRVALIGAGAPLEDELDRLQLEPELEPVLLDRGEETVPSAWEHPHLPGARDYLLQGLNGASRARLLPALAARTEALVRRARRPGSPLGHGADGLLAGLAGCERLVVVNPDWPADEPLTRELWRIAATVRAASALGVEVELRPGALGDARLRRRRLDRALVADVQRHAG
jgi:hypothetical protein